MINILRSSRRNHSFRRSEDTKGKTYMPICGIDSYEDDIFGCIPDIVTNRATDKDVTTVDDSKNTIKVNVTPKHLGGFDYDNEQSTRVAYICNGIAKCRYLQGRVNDTILPFS
ncbi:unnamed protein product [Colias eurytheme]|nr:unnamed protein product [Colias eurytheme]